MRSIAELLEQELEGAVEVKDRGFLHRYVALLTENFVQREDTVEEIGVIKRDIGLINETIRQILERFDMRFEQIERRFEQVDKRFEQVDRRFEETLSLMDRRFSDLQHNMDKRFEQVDKRFTMMISFMSVGFIVLTTLITVLKLFG